MLLRLLSEEHRNLCVVGDSDQSVYGFRGADAATSSSSRRTTPTPGWWCSTRTTDPPRPSSDAANAVIANNSKRKPKELWAIVEGEPVYHYQAEDEHDEAGMVADELNHLEDVGLPARPGSGLLPHQCPEPRARGGHGPAWHPLHGGGERPLLRAREVKDVLAYLRAVVNPTDEVALKRVISVPKQGSDRPPSGTSSASPRPRGRLPRLRASCR